MFSYILGNGLVANVLVGQVLGWLIPDFEVVGTSKWKSSYLLMYWYLIKFSFYSIDPFPEFVSAVVLMLLEIVLKVLIVYFSEKAFNLGKVILESNILFIIMRSE